MYPVGEYGLAVFSERLTVSCLANPRLRRKPTNLWRPLSALFREILGGEGLRART